MQREDRGPSILPPARQAETQVQASLPEEEVPGAQESSLSIAQPASLAEVPPQAPETVSAPSTLPLPVYSYHTPSALPYNSDRLNSQAVKSVGELASHVIYKVALSAKFVIDTQGAKRPPPFPPASIAAQNSGLALDALPPDDYFLNFDSEGRKERLDQLVRNASDPTSPFAQFVADQDYKGQTLIQRAAHLEIVNELVTSTLRNLHFKLALADPLKLFKIVQKFIHSAQRLGDSLPRLSCAPLHSGTH